MAINWGDFYKKGSAPTVKYKPVTPVKPIRYEGEDEGKRWRKKKVEDYGRLPYQDLAPMDRQVLTALDQFKLWMKKEQASRNRQYAEAEATAGARGQGKVNTYGYRPFQQKDELYGYQPESTPLEELRRQMAEFYGGQYAQAEATAGARGQGQVNTGVQFPTNPGMTIMETAKYNYEKAQEDARTDEGARWRGKTIPPRFSGHVTPTFPGSFIDPTVALGNYFKPEVNYGQDESRYTTNGVPNWAQFGYPLQPGWIDANAGGGYGGGYYSPGYGYGGGGGWGGWGGGGGYNDYNRYFPALGNQAQGYTQYTPRWLYSLMSNWRGL